MFVTRQNLIRTTAAFLGLAALGAAFGLGTVVAQQPMPPTKVSQLMKQTLADVPGREVMMITLDIPPGGGSPAHRHPGAHNFGYVLEGAYKYKLDNGPETVVTKGQTFYEFAWPTPRGVAQCERHRACQGAGRGGQRGRQAAHGAGKIIRRRRPHDLFSDFDHSRPGVAASARSRGNGGDTSTVPIQVFARRSSRPATNSSSKSVGVSDAKVWSTIDCTLTTARRRSSISQSTAVSTPHLEQMTHCAVPWPNL